MRDGCVPQGNSMARAKRASERATVPKLGKFADGAIAYGRSDSAAPKSVELAPKDAICRLKLGTAYLRLGKLIDARRDLEKAVQLAPDDPAAHYQLGKLYKEMKAVDRAKANSIERRNSRAVPHPPNRNRLLEES